MKPRVAVLVSHGPGSALDIRARSLFEPLADRYETRFAYHRGGSLARIILFSRFLHEVRPDLIYVLDPIYAAVAATRHYRLRHNPGVILDTGDLVYELAREMGKLGRLQLGIVQWAEQTALHLADAIVVRGSEHRALLTEQGYPLVEFIPDGVDLTQFVPMDALEIRTRLFLGKEDLVVGTLGTISWNVRRQICYGWDLVEAIALVRDLPVRGLLIGSGDGVARLQTRAHELGIADKIIFVPRIPYPDLPRYINAMDICLLTQPNSNINSVRTTGKLPLYLACDRYVLASQVGEAAHVLPSEMLLPYDGMGRDEEYPKLLAHKIWTGIGHPERWRLNGRNSALARAHFDYAQIAHKLGDVLEGVLVISNR